MRYINEQDLHMHTIYSDGTNRPSQIVKDNALLGNTLIAITDHDNTKGYYEAKEESKKWGIELITGVEVSAERFHILGHDFDIENKEFQDFLKYSKELQENTYRRKVEKLQKYGVPITWEKVKDRFPESRIGGFNVFMTLIRDSVCRKYNKGLSASEIYQKYIKKGGIVYEVEDQIYVPTKETIQQIHNAGGQAIVAHPFKEADKPEELERLIREGIDGLEYQPNYNGRNEPFLAYAKEKNLIITRGSDYHGGSFPHRPLLTPNLASFVSFEKNEN
jgi:predicted metal-dependent phosphoesterase TrpH